MGDLSFKDMNDLCHRSSLSGEAANVSPFALPSVQLPCPAASEASFTEWVAGADGPPAAAAARCGCSAWALHGRADGRAPPGRALGEHKLRGSHNALAMLRGEPSASPACAAALSDDDYDADYEADYQQPDYHVVRAHHQMARTRQWLAASSSGEQLLPDTAASSGAGAPDDCCRPVWKAALGGSARTTVTSRVAAQLSLGDSSDSSPPASVDLLAAEGETWEGRVHGGLPRVASGQLLSGTHGRGCGAGAGLPRFRSLPNVQRGAIGGGGLKLWTSSSLMARESSYASTIDRVLEEEGY